MQQVSATLKSVYSEGFTRRSGVAMLVTFFLPTKIFGDKSKYVG
jgi:hypothetical protein